MVTNNLAFDKRNKRDSDLQGDGCTMCVLKFVRDNLRQINDRTFVSGNVADEANGGKIVFKHLRKKYKRKFWEVAGNETEDKMKKVNLFDAKIEEELMDAENFDFRPVEGSTVATKNLGPYDYKKGAKQYWIPGAQSYKALFPVPPNESETVRADRRDALMWLQALGCEDQHIHFGPDKKTVKDAPVKRAFKGDKVPCGENVYYHGQTLAPGTSYYWRVDSKMSDGSIYKGDVWTFKTK